MRLIVFVIKKRLKSYFKECRWESYVGIALYALALFIYAAACGYFYRKGDPTKVPILMKGVCMALLFVPLFNKIFPTFSLKKLFVAPQYPLSMSRKATVDLLAFALFKAIYLILLVFILIFYISAGSIPFKGMLILLAYWLTGILFAENLHNAISWKRVVYIALLVILAGVYFLDFISAWRVPEGLLLLMDMLVLVIAFYYFYQDRVPETIRKKGGRFLIMRSQLNYRRTYEKTIKPNAAISNQVLKKRSYWATIGRLLLGNKNACGSLLLGILVINTLMPIAFLSSLKFSERGGLAHMLQKVPLMACLFLPLVLFTYVFENLWGFFYQLEVNHLIITPGFKKQFKIYLSLYLPVAAIVALLASAITLFYHSFSWRILVAYFSFSFLAIPISVLTSSIKYGRMEKNFEFFRIRLPTSILANLILIVMASLIGCFYDSTYFLTVIVAFILLGGILLWCIYKGHRRLSRKLKWRMLERRQ